MADLTLTFLGTGTSQGVPMLTCDCAVCTSSDPRDQRLRASIYVETPECAWVVDTGPDFRAQALRARLRRLDAVVYTHAHTDHIMGFDDLRPFCHGGRDLPIHGSRETLADLARAFAFAFDGAHRSPGYIRPEPREVTGPFLLGDTEITPLPVPHGRFTVNGYLLTRAGERLAAYLSDCNAVPDDVISQIKGVRALIIDGLRHSSHPTHLSVGEALAVAEKVQPREAWLTHLCHELGHAETERELPTGAHIAYDGLRLSL